MNAFDWVVVVIVGLGLGAGLFWWFITRDGRNPFL